MRVRFVVASAATVLAGITVPVVNANASVAPISNIIGGDTVSSAPWAASVSDDRGPGCSGTIVAANWVLTATHCFSTTRPMTVRASTTSLTTGGFTSKVDAARSVSRYDLTLLRLTTPITTTYVKLAKSGAYPVVRTSNTIYGWGATCENCGMSSTLRSATVQVVSLSSQKDNGGGPAILSGQVRVNGPAAWRGDSGGPEFDNGAQVGVASLANMSQQVYADIADPGNRAWITTTAGV